jgi:hypothetical protein
MFSLAAGAGLVFGAITIRESSESSDQVKNLHCSPLIPRFREAVVEVSFFFPQIASKPIESFPCLHHQVWSGHLSNPHVGQTSDLNWVRSMVFGTWRDGRPVKTEE